MQNYLQMQARSFDGRSRNRLQQANIKDSEISQISNTSLH